MYVYLYLYICHSINVCFICFPKIQCLRIVKTVLIGINEWSDLWNLLFSEGDKSRQIQSSPI
jgi:hypothetical protein